MHGHLPAAEKENTAEATTPSPRGAGTIAFLPGLSWLLYRHPDGGM